MPPPLPREFVAQLRRCWLWLPEFGIGVFIALYFCAAARYPGGTSLQRDTRGYDHFANYWCDLLDPVAYCGEPNPGRRFALLATVLLPLTLLPLWLNVPVLFRGGGTARWLVPASGSAAMLLTTLVFSAQHDLAVNFASLFGFSAALATTWQLWRAQRRGLCALTALLIALSAVNYFMWQSRWHVEHMPVVQKACYALLFAWVCVVMHAIRRAPARQIA